MKKCLALLLAVLLIVPSSFAEGYSQNASIVDEAKLFSSDEITALAKEIENFRNKTKMDFVVVTTKHNHNLSQQEFADSFYDKGNYGLGENHSGILYYIDMYNRIPYLYTTGDMIDFMTDSRISLAHESSYSFLVQGNYAQAVSQMIEVVSECIEAGIPEGQYRYDAGTGKILEKDSTEILEAANSVTCIFSFRNEIKWGDTKEKIRLSEQGTPWEAEEDNFFLLTYENVTVSNFSAELVYGFVEDCLVNAWYQFDSMENEDYEYLVAALSTKYGMPITADSCRQSTVLKLYKSDDIAMYKLTNWEFADGTYIALFSMDKELKEDYILMYSDEDTILEILGIYNTAGL